MRTMQLSVLKRLDNLVAGARARAAIPVVGAANESGKAAPPAALGDLSGVTTAFIDLAAMDLTPKGSGRFQYTATVNYTLDGADTVTFNVDAVPLVTAISGGTASGNFHYESGTPIVVTGGAPVVEIPTVDQIAAGQIAAVSKTISGFVQLAPLGGRQAIVLAVKTAGGAHLTGITLTTLAFEIA